MSNRTPTLQARSQFHAYWGQYAWNAGGSDAGAANLPNDTANALPQPYFSQLEVGDTASTTDAATANRGLWVCVSTGTVGGADAQWRRCDNGAAATQTVRDAHVIVVAQSGRLTTLFGATPPPANRLNLVAVTGDSANVTCDFLDLGDGAQLALALLAAAAAGVGVDVRLRACSIAMNQAGSPVQPLTVSANCRLSGGGRAISLVSGDDRVGNTQEMFVLGLRAELDNLSINSPSQAAPGAGASFAVIRTSSSFVRIHDCALLLDGAARTQPWMIWDASGTADIDDCTFDGAGQTDVSTGSIGIVMGNPTTLDALTVPTFDFHISNCTFRTFNRMLFTYNVTGGSMEDCFGSLLRCSAGAIENFFAGAPVAPAPGLGLRLNNIRIVVATTETEGDPEYVGVRVTNAISTGFVLAGTMWSQIEVVFSPGVAPTVPRVAFEVETGGDGAKIEGGTFTSLIAVGHSEGVRLTSQGPTALARISDLMFSTCLLKNPTTIGASVGTGMALLVAALGDIQDISVANCNARNAPATGFGINISDPAITNTIVLGCNLVPSGGTALSDTGTGTEAAHNILA